MAHSSTQQKWKPSRYNWILPIEEEGGGGALYNAYTGSCLDLGLEDFALAQKMLSDITDNEINFRSLGDCATTLGGALITGGFVVEDGFDELADLETRTESKVDGLPLVLTINPTFACNLGCSYCFVGKKQGLMTRETEQELISFVKGYLTSNDVPSVNVDWFGGEPLLARKSMERLSTAFLSLCEEYSVPYRAQVITNGTLLTREIASKLATWGIDRIQITLDGDKVTHNTRRPWKGRSASVIARSSYDDSLSGIENVIGKFAVRLRLNVDRRNLEEAFSLLSMFDHRGWLAPEMQFYPYPSMVSDYTEAAVGEWSPTEACYTEHFYDVHRRWLDFLNARGVPVVNERLYGFPEPTTIACGAVSERGWVVNFDGQLHKCGFDCDSDSRAVGSLGKALVQEDEDLKYWTTYKPIADPVCRECPALPVCLGGCARDRRENRSKAMAETCEFHLKYEPKIVAQHVRLRRENNRKARATQ